MSTTDIDLTPFCDSNISRFDLSRPFVRDGWLYATDGRILIRIPSSRPDTNDRPLPKTVANIMLDFAECIEWHPWPGKAYITCYTRTCWRCRGLRRVGEDVHVCKGCECGECSGGKGVGGSECPECDGEGAIMPLAYPESKD